MAKSPPVNLIPSAPSGQRKPHRKSRTGCQQCKQRKIKCDECKPACGYCSRLQEECSYSSSALKESPVNNALAPPSSTSSDLLDVGNSPSFPFPLWDDTFTSLELAKLELLHFYTSTTCLTLSIVPELRQIWQHTVPRIAFSHPFLLHGILAFSALHLSRTSSDSARREILYTEASNHYDVGLRMFRTAMLNLAPENCDACLAFSMITAGSFWASSNEAGDLFFSETPTSEENPSWAGILRGVNILLEASAEWMTTSSVKEILYPRPLDPSLAAAPDQNGMARLAALSKLWDNVPTKFDHAEIQALNSTLALLQEDYALLTSSVDIVSIVFAWPIRVSEDFLVMVKALQPEALILLAHYSLLLNNVHHIWFMQGMSRHLLRSIHSKIGTEWQSWIAWPLQDLVLTEFKDHEKDVSSMTGIISNVN